MLAKRSFSWCRLEATVAVTYLGKSQSSAHIVRGRKYGWQLPFSLILENDPETFRIVTRVLLRPCCARLDESVKEQQGANF